MGFLAIKRWLAGLSVARALRRRNYRLFFFGQGVSQIGTWIQRIAQSWLVYEMTDSAFLLGVVGFSGHILTFVAAPFAGVLADKVSRRQLLVITQTVAMILAFILAALMWTGTIAIWHIIAMSLILGLVSAFDMPTRHSFVIEMVEDQSELANAIALNSFLMNGAKLIGPSIAGVLVALVGEAWCFFLNGVSFLAVIVALLVMKIRPMIRRAGQSSVFENLKEGFLYAFGFAPIRAILTQLGLVSLLGMSYSVLMPVFAKDILHGGPQTQGFLTAAGGVGAIVGALALASRKSVLGLGRVIGGSTLLFGAALIAFAFSRNVELSLVLLAIGGAGSMVQMASCNTLIQTIVDDDKRGRVMSFYAMALMGMHPFGSLLSGALASKLGAPAALVVCGVGCLLTAAFFFIRLPSLRKAARPVYIEKGIMTETADESGVGAFARVKDEQI